MRYLALALALVSTAASAQPDLIVDDLYTDSLCLGPNPYFSVHFTITNIGDETCEYFCYEKNGVEVCPDTTILTRCFTIRAVMNTVRIWSLAYT